MGINHSLKPVMEDKDEGWKFQIMERVLEVCSPVYLYPYPVCLIWNNYFWIRYGKNNKKLRCLHFEFFMTIYVRYGSGCESRTN